MTLPAFVGLKLHLQLQHRINITSSPYMGRYIGSTPFFSGPSSHELRHTHSSNQLVCSTHLSLVAPAAACARALQPRPPPPQSWCIPCSSLSVAPPPVRPFSSLPPGRHVAPFILCDAQSTALVAAFLRWRRHTCCSLDGLTSQEP